MNTILPLSATTVNPLLQACLEADANLELIALATGDGFGVASAVRDVTGYEQDKMAAAASTLHSVSNAVAKQILRKRFDMTLIETEAGNMAFIAIEHNTIDYVLAMSAGSGMNLATLRLLIKRIAQQIRQL